MREAMSRARQRVVVSDDFEDMAVALRIFLEERGYDVRVALDAMATMELARSWQPHLIITDILKPDVDGFKMMVMLGEDDCTSGIPILVLSAIVGEHDTGGYRKTAVDLGACEVIAKPITDYDGLLAAVKRCLSQP